MLCYRTRIALQSYSTHFPGCGCVRALTGLAKEVDFGMRTEFGERVRARRSALDLRLKDLAKASGVSVSMLSQVERGTRVPTLPIALKIAEGLGCALSTILDEPADHQYGIVRLEDGAGRGDPVSGVRRYLLSRHLPPSVAEITWYAIPVGSTAGPFIHGDVDLLEQVTVITGRLEVMVGAEVHQLRKGDTLFFKGTVEHRFVNRGRSEISLVHIAHPRRHGPLT